MNSILRSTAVVAVFSAASLAAPPPPEPMAAPLKPPTVVEVIPPAVPAEYPLSCNPVATPLVFKAWDASANARMDESREALQLAVAADPKCVMARAHLGTVTPGIAGTKLFNEAMKEIANVSEVERLDLQALEASRNGDPETAWLLSQKMVGLAPNVFFVNLTAGHYAKGLQKFDEAAASARKATELDPMNGAAWNLLGYAQLRVHRHDEAIAAFRRYLELSPNEPKGHDSLGDALLADNQLDQAAAHYQMAIDISGGTFTAAWSGIASVKAIKGDWEGARAAIARQRASATQPYDKVRTHELTAWTYAAEGKLSDALKAVDASQKEATAAKLDAAIAHAQVLRGKINLASGKYADALKAFTAADKVNVAALPAGKQKKHRTQVLSGLTEAQARLGQTADAEKTLATLDQYVKENVTGPFATDTMAFTRGVVALGMKDPKAAIVSFKQCSEPFDYCRLMLSEAQDKAADVAGAAETRIALTRANHRDPEYWFVRARVATARKAPGT